MIEKGTNWTTQIKRIARPSWGATPKYVRRLFIGVALPKLLYGADVWYNPPPTNRKAANTGNRGTVRITKKLTSVQRAGALAVTGGLRTSPTNVIDALGNLIPFEQVIEMWCYRVAL